MIWLLIFLMGMVLKLLITLIKFLITVDDPVGPGLPCLDSSINITMDLCEMPSWKLCVLLFHILFCTLSFIWQVRLGLV